MGKKKNKMQQGADKCELTREERIALSARDLADIFENHSNQTFTLSVEKEAVPPFPYWLRPTDHNEHGQKIVNKIDQGGHDVVSANIAFQKALQITSYDRDVSYDAEGKHGLVTVGPRLKR